MRLTKANLIGRIIALQTFLLKGEIKINKDQLEAMTWKQLNELHNKLRAILINK